MDKAYPGVQLAKETEGGGDLDLSKYLRLALKHRFLILGTTLAALIIGVTITLLTTPLYSATATIQIDREAARVLDSEGVAPAESMVAGIEFFETQYGLLRSRSLAERVIDSLGLATSDTFLERMDVSAPGASDGTAAQRAAKRREQVLKVVQDNLAVSPVRGSRLATISFSSPDPRLSAQIVNAFAENFIQSNLDRKFESTAYVRQFLEERIAQTKGKLEDAERELVAYAEGQQIVNVTEANENGGAAQSLASNNLLALNAALAQARAVRVQTEEKWRQARTASPMSLPEVLQNSAVQHLNEERVKLNAQYQQKLSVYKPDFPEMLQLKAQIDELDRQIRTLADSIRASIQGQYVVAANQERSLQNQVNGLTNEVMDLRDRSIEYNILQREVDTSRTLYDALLQRYKEVSATNGVMANNISIVDRAEAPDSPSSPKLILNLALALLIGLGLGLAGALLLEALDETLEKPEDVEEKLGMPVLGVVPLLDKSERPLDALSNPRSNFSEAYYSIRTALQFSTPNGAPASLLITSSRPAEGKSTTAYATALNLARLGRKVLLADGDLRNPSMHRVLGMENEAGMSNLLSGGGDLRALAQRTSQEGLDFIACGPLPPNPAELWGGDRLKRMLDEATTVYDHVVIDGPPILGFADAPLLASAVEGTILVIEAKGTRRAQARGAIRRLTLGHARVLGAILTKFNTRTARYGGYDYTYDYNYGAAEASAKGRIERSA
ncbi:GumC family protein [Brevundimonas sp.]|uniref:GumC family protein n=1 Tax=Brevundimonas sp. TaxID=1871086 RepID=UPI002FC773AC